MLQSLSVKLTVSVFAFLFALSSAVYAQNGYIGSTETNPEESIQELQDSLSSSTDSIEDIRKKADDVLRTLSPKRLLSSIKNSVLNELSKVSAVFSGVLALLFLSALFLSIGESFSQENLFIYAALLLIILLTLSPVINCIELTKSTCDKLCTFMLSFIPTISAVSAAGGNTVSASTGAVLCSSALAFLEVLAQKLLIPGTKICVALCAVSCLGKGAELSGISSFVKNTCMWISGLIMTIFCGVLSLQSFIGTGADSLAMRGIKFTASKLIPVAGGMVSESLKTVVAGAGYIKSIAGTAAVAYIIYSVMPALCGILAVKLLFYFSGMCAKLTGQRELQGYLDSVSNALNLLYAVCALCSVSFVVMLAIFMKTSVSV